MSIFLLVFVDKVHGHGVVNVFSTASVLLPGNNNLQRPSLVIHLLLHSQVPKSHFPLHSISRHCSNKPKAKKNPPPLLIMGKEDCCDSPFLSLFVLVQ